MLFNAFVWHLHYATVNTHHSNTPQSDTTLYRQRLQDMYANFGADPSNSSWVIFADGTNTWRHINFLDWYLNGIRYTRKLVYMDGIKVSMRLSVRSFFTETKMLSFWRNFNHWLHWKLSFWQLPVQPVMKISSKWRHFRFSVCVCNTP